MPDIVIKAENLGKKYVIGHQAERGDYTLLRDVLMQNANSMEQDKRLATGKPVIQGDTLEEVWALKDVSFEARGGDRDFITNSHVEHRDLKSLTLIRI